MKGESMPFRLRLRMIVFGILFCVAVLPPDSAQNVKLTRAQVEQLIRIPGPDADDSLASAIRSSGLSFPVDRKIVKALSAKGAGPLTLAALREQIHEGVVEVRYTEPGSQVLLDGIVAGNADTLGYFALKEVPEGNHERTVKKDGYGDAHLQFSLANKEDKQLSLSLEWLGGYLSVSALPLAAIHVTGPLSFEGRATDLKCPTGSYTVTASSEGYATQTHTFQVGAGEHHAEHLQLEVDPAFVASLMADAKAKLDAGNPNGAIESARKLLNVAPGAKAEEILAEASLRAGDFQSFLNAGRKAIRGGGEVSITLTHRHRGFVHDVTLTLSRDGLSFHTPASVNGCNLPNTTQPYRSLSRLIFKSQLYREIGVDNVTPDIALEFGFIQAKHFTVVTSPIDYDSAGNLLKWYEFASPGSRIGPHSSSPLESPENAQQALESLAELIRWVTAQPEFAQSNQQGISGATGTTPSALVSCSDYNSCWVAGNQRMFNDEDRSSAIPYFQHALDFRKDATGWIYLGTAYLRAGQPDGTFTAWDEVMKLNKQIGMPVCHSNGFSECESGMLILGPKNVTWQVSGRKVFDIPATGVKVIGNEDHQSEGYISFGLEVDGTKFDFEFVTVGVPLTKGSKHVFTDAQGMAQQWTVGDYMSQTIKKLAAGGY
jgi:tetratricopeptide (TPR) repeat protein